MIESQSDVQMIEKKFQSSHVSFSCPTESFYDAMNDVKNMNDETDHLLCISK